MSDPAELRNFLQVCEAAARAGGQVLRDWVGRFAAREKGPADLVTEADLASQETIKNLVLGAFPEHGFLGEEGGAIEAPSDGYRWIVDPLDGTLNYVHGLAYYCVSVALEKAGHPLVGCVYDPVAGQCFTAASGQGARLDGRPIQVRGSVALADAMVAASLSARLDPLDQEMRDFVAIASRCGTIRRLGSAALNLCHVASGTLDAYWALSNKPWDVAAGFVILEEAGGLVTDFEGGRVELAQPRFIAASCDSLRREIQQVLEESRRS